MKMVILFSIQETHVQWTHVHAYVQKFKLDAPFSQQTISILSFESSLIWLIMKMEAKYKMLFSDFSIHIL